MRQACHEGRGAACKGLACPSAGARPPSLPPAVAVPTPTLPCIGHAGDKPYVTDNSNYIVDLYFETPIADAHAGGCTRARLVGWSVAAQD